MVTISIDGVMLTVQGESVACPDAGISEKAASVALVYSPSFGDAELWIADEIVGRIGGKIVSTHDPMPETVVPGEEDLEKAGVGVMVAWFPPKDLLETLGQGATEKPEDLHVTILYYGKDLTEDQVELLKTRMMRLARRLAPLQGTIGGTARFPATPSSDDKDVIVRLADVPRLEALREMLIEESRKVGIEPVLNHGYTPHMTLAYVDPEAGEEPEGVTVPIAVNSLTLTLGPERIEYPLNGEEVLKSDLEGFEKFNPCHNRGDGQFCSTGGNVNLTRQTLAGGIKSELYEHSDAPGASLQVVVQRQTGYRSVSDVYVPEEYQGKGVATDLYLAALKQGPLLATKEIGENLTRGASQVREKLVSRGKAHYETDEYDNRLLVLGGKAEKSYKESDLEGLDKINACHGIDGRFCSGATQGFVEIRGFHRDRGAEGSYQAWGFLRPNGRALDGTADNKTHADLAKEQGHDLSRGAVKAGLIRYAETKDGDWLLESKASPQNNTAMSSLLISHYSGAGRVLIDLHTENGKQSKRFDEVASAVKFLDLVQKSDLDEEFGKVGIGPTASAVHVDRPLWDDEEEEDLEMEAAKSDDMELQGTIIKADLDKQMVFGWASVVEKGGESVTDRQGDQISEEEMEKMAYSFMLDSRRAGEMHKRSEGVGRLVESIAFTKQKQESLGIDLGKTGWWIGFKIDDPDVWEKVKKGEYKAFSIHGKGLREKIKE